MELTDNSLVFTHREAGAMADCLRGFEGMGRLSKYGRQPTDEDRQHAEDEARAVYEMVSPIHNGMYLEPSDTTLEIPREEMPRIERVLDKLLDNPMMAVDNICLEWAHDYNHHLRRKAYRTLGWIAEVQVALEQIRIHPDETDEQSNRRLNFAGSV